MIETSHRACSCQGGTFGTPPISSPPISLKQMRQIAPAVRVVILTGSTPDQGLEALALKEGAIGFITKPIQIDELAPKIQALIKGEKP